MDVIAKLIQTRDKLNTMAENEKSLQKQLSPLVTQLSEIIAEMQANTTVFNLEQELHRTTSHRLRPAATPGRIR